MSNTDPERLARLRRRASHCTTHHEACDCRELAHAKLEAEVARLNAEARRMTALHARTVEELDAARAQLAVAMPLVKAVLSDDTDDYWCCRIGHCDPKWSDEAGRYVHEPHCPIEPARSALLARADAEGAGATPSVASDIAAGILSGGPSLTVLIRADRDGTGTDEDAEGSAT